MGKSVEGRSFHLGYAGFTMPLRYLLTPEQKLNLLVLGGRSGPGGTLSGG